MARGGLRGCETSRIPNFLDNLLTGGCDVSRLAGWLAGWLAIVRLKGSFNFSFSIYIYIYIYIYIKLGQFRNLSRDMDGVKCLLMQPELCY
jgi:hypothetical protein